jgi:hypothetical protein
MRRAKVRALAGLGGALLWGGVMAGLASLHGEPLAVPFGIGAVTGGLFGLLAACLVLNGRAVR